VSGSIAGFRLDNERKSAKIVLDDYALLNLLLYENEPCCGDPIFQFIMHL
jgi:hypothetical protein